MTHGESVYTIRKQIADHIRADILSGQLLEGEQVREQLLAQRFGVSLGPIRDVLLQLTQEGLLISKRNCGVRVGPAPDEWIQSLVVDLRQRIEIFALRKVLKALDYEAIQCQDGHPQGTRGYC